MNIVLLSDDEVDDQGGATLEGRRFNHLSRVLKVVPNQKIRVGIIDGGRGTAIVSEINDQHVRLQIDIREPPLPAHPVIPIIALPRPKMLRRIFRQCAEFGVEEIHLINSYRVEKSFWQTPLLRPEKIRSALLEGLERSGATKLPRVHLHQRFKPFVEDEFGALRGSKHAWIAHPSSALTLPTDITEPSLICIGPEGGFIPFEVELLATQGAQTAHLGTRILSVDTAVTCVLGRTLVG
ncbi:MAG: 16S rRNA (uracil(1498)-N(3))-methyltransferase [Halieaceae bacterium]